MGSDSVGINPVSSPGMGHRPADSTGHCSALNGHGGEGSAGLAVAGMKQPTDPKERSVHSYHHRPFVPTLE